MTSLRVVAVLAEISYLIDVFSLIRDFVEFWSWCNSDETGAYWIGVSVAFALILVVSRGYLRKSVYCDSCRTGKERRLVK